ncbi:unnamed protein product, partial [Phaeothamnion confervicola]
CGAGGAAAAAVAAKAKKNPKRSDGGDGCEFSDEYDDDEEVDSDEDREPTKLYDPLWPRALGVVTEIFGPVTCPCYVVHVGSLNEVPRHVQIGSIAYVVKEMPNEVLDGSCFERGRGCDASNAFDEEAGDNEADFSDDEKEQLAKKTKGKGKVLFGVLVGEAGAKGFGPARPNGGFAANGGGAGGSGSGSGAGGGNSSGNG